MKFKITRNKVFVAIAIIAVLVATYWYGGGAPGLQGWNVSPYSSSNASLANQGDSDSNDLINDSNQNVNDSIGRVPDKSENKLEETPETKHEEKAEEKPKEKPAYENKKSETVKPAEENKTNFESRPGGIEGGLSSSEKVELAKKLAGGGSSPGVEKGSKNYSESQGMVIDASTGKDKYLTDPVPEGKPIPVEPQNAKITDVARTCTLSVRCDTILNNIDWLDPEKVELVPKDGVIYATKTVTFYEGESVFNVLQREMKNAKIHMEFSNTPMYNSAYIEGIHNLYEFDCGELSGWMYKVNKWFPNYGCSRYVLKEGDVIEWVYTCDLGVDVGGFYSVGS